MKIKFKDLMIKSIFPKIINYIKQFFIFILNIPKLIKHQVEVFILDFKNLQYNLKNLKEANTKLGIYHLNNQNYNDAIFRFKLVDKFLEPNNSYVNYQMGWAYFLKRNYKQALIHLEKGRDEDKVHLADFIKNINHALKIPNEIYSIYRGIAIDKFIDNASYELARELIIHLIQAIDTLPENYNILELGSNIGIIGREISRRMQEGFKITGVEVSEEMINLQQGNRFDSLYNEIINSPVDEYLSKDRERQYDIVISMNGFANYSDVRELFNKTYEALSAGGYFALAIRISEIAGFREKYLEFSYDKNHINELLKQSSFEIVSDLDLKLVTDNNYSIIMCKKTSMGINNAA